MEPAAGPSIQRQRLSELISSRSSRPRFQGRLERIDAAGSAINPWCGDAVTVAVMLDPTRLYLRRVRCSTEGCAVCKASADLMAEALEGSPVSRAREDASQFQLLLETGLSPWPDAHCLSVFSALYGIPARVRCALLPWHALHQALAALPTPSA